MNVSTKKQLGQFRLTEPNAILLDALQDETGRTKRELVSCMLSTYAKNPFPLKPTHAERRGEYPFVSDEVQKLIEFHAEKAGVPVATAVRQIVESFLEEKPHSNYLNSIKLSMGMDNER